VASSGPALTGPGLPCAEGSRAGRRTPGGVLPDQRGRIPSLAGGYAAGDAAQDLIAFVLMIKKD